jgi:phosphotransferase system HPr (HPr) family protein
MQQFTHTITDPNGIHARPAGLLAQQMQGFKSNITITKDAEGTSANAKQLIGLMKLRLKCGQTFTLTAEGEDEAVAIEAAKTFLAVNL